MTTIVLVEDHRIVRQGLKALLESNPTFQVVGEAADGLEAVGLIKQVQPDIVVTDLNIPGINGIDVVRSVKESCRNTKIIILSMHQSDDFVLPAFESGASGYVLKDACVEDLESAIQEAIAGNRYLSPQLAQRAIDSYLHAGYTTESDPYATLTQRERQVVQLTAQGYTYGEIADQLHISPRTAETHRTNVMHKLGLASTPDLVRYAIRKGLVSVD